MTGGIQPHDRRIHADAVRRQRRQSQWSRFKRQCAVMLSSVALGTLVVPYAMLDQNRIDAITAWSVAKAKLWAMSGTAPDAEVRSEEHTSELQSLMRISYAVFCLKKKKNRVTRHTEI